MPDTNEIKLIIEAFKNYTQYDFTQYSEKSFGRRVDKLLQTYSLNEILLKIQTDKDFAEKIKNEITVNTTELFRDTDTWVEIQNTIIPKLKKLKTIKIWHAGASSGEEVYSMLILLHANNLLEETQILATDINDKILLNAQEGEYKNNIIADYIKNFNDVFSKLGKEKIKIEDFFNVDYKKDLLKVKDFLKQRVRFQFHDLVNNNPEITETFDLIVCRNVLIYFNMNLQNKIIENFYNQLNSNGAIILGVHECILSPVDKKFNKIKTIYIKK